MEISRRNALTFLGLATPASAALATENMLEMPDHGLQLASSDWEKGKKTCEALRRLIVGIESGEVEVSTISVNSEIRPDEVLTQELKVRFRLNEPNKTT